MPDNKTPKYQYDHYDFGDMLDSAVEAGSKIGSSQGRWGFPNRIL